MLLKRINNLYGALIIGICLLLVVAYGEEKKIRSLNKAKNEAEELVA